MIQFYEVRALVSVVNAVIKDKSDVKELLEKSFFEIVPYNVAVIDKNYEIIAANSNFEKYFGEWRRRSCFQVCKRLDRPCTHCKVNNVFKHGKVVVSDESGIDRAGRHCHYVVHLAPLIDKRGNIEYVIEMSTDITETNRYQREYNILFERVPSFVSIIDRDYRIVRANKKFRDTFGEVRSKHCYEVYKKRKKICKNCPARLTFEDGKDHQSTEVGLSKDGEETYYVINTTPLSVDEDGVQLIIEIATDITEVTMLQEQLREAHDFYARLVKNAADGIVAINESRKTQIFNPAAQRLFGRESNRKPNYLKLKELLPEEFFGEPDENGILIDTEETYLKSENGKEIPVRIKASELKSRRKSIGRAAFIEDLTKIKKLEREKLDAERLGAVGQTVAGLAHTIKNLLMGLEGGIYMTDTGLKKGDAKRIFEGWEVLQRNFNKITTLVKDFLSFSKGRLPDLKLIDPNSLAEDIYNLYKDAAEKQGVELKLDPSEDVHETPLDPGGMEACLTNLISNAIDAAMLREDGAGEVVIRTKEEDDSIVYQVEDNGAGMDSEIIQKIFTTFFTTKGGKGTGLGLLTTRKIVQEHGGKINAVSEPDKGSIFTIKLPRYRLQMILEQANSENK